MKGRIIVGLKWIKRLIKYFCSVPYLLYYALAKKRYFKFNVLTREESLRYIKENRVSIARFGDGEFRWMTGQKQQSFQNDSKELANRLKEVINSDDDSIAIGIGDAFNDIDKLDDTLQTKVYWKTQMVVNGREWIKYLVKEKQYLNANISRFYIDLLDVQYAENIVSLWREIWNDKRIIIIEGEYSRLGIGNDLFNNVQQLQRIIVPSTNAFNCYEEILRVAQQYDADLYLLAVGPTATVLAYDLAKLGHWAIDIGHIDIEYEWYKQRATKKVPVKNRAVNECGHQHTADELPIKLREEYEKQVLTTIRLSE